MSMAIVALENGARRLSAVDELAASEGAFPGQSMADALALLPRLKIVDAEVDEDAAALGRLADWCVRFSPNVAIDPPDGLFFDIAGCAHLWGGEAAMAAALLQRLTTQTIPARIAIADTFGAAWALARYASETVTIAQPDDEAILLSSLPVAALRLDDSQAHQLRRLGLTTIGQVARLPRVALRKRFGDDLMLRLAQTRGEADEALHFRYPPAPWSERKVFAEPIGKPEDLMLLLRDLAGALCVRLERAGLGSRSFQAAFYRVDGDVAVRDVGTALPAREPRRLVDLFAPKLETLDPGFGIETVVLSAGEVEPLKHAQFDLVEATVDARNADLAPLIDRLRNRFGAGQVWRAIPYPSHVPERAATRIAPLELPRNETWNLEQSRPVRLLRWPEPLDQVLAPLPDDPPRRFHWRGHAHLIRRAEGPERIGAEWWRRPWAQNADDRIRDYYQVEDDKGARFWVFRTGLHGGPRDVQWWLHGFFA